LLVLLVSAWGFKAEVRKLPTFADTLGRSKPGGLAVAGHAIFWQHRISWFWLMTRFEQTQWQCRGLSSKGVCKGSDPIRISNASLINQDEVMWLGLVRAQEIPAASVYFVSYLATRIKSPRAQHQGARKTIS
jgi:hypothetical protein